MRSHPKSEKTHNPQELILSSIGSRSSLGGGVGRKERRVGGETEQSHCRGDGVNETAFACSVVAGDSSIEGSGVFSQNTKRRGGVGDPVVCDARMINQVLADFSIVEDGGNAQGLKSVLVADSGK